MKSLLVIMALVLLYDGLVWTTTWWLGATPGDSLAAITIANVLLLFVGFAAAIVVSEWRR